MNSPVIPSATVTEELEKVLNSAAFKASGRSARLLRFLVEETLSGRADRLKDYTLGAEALGRGESFDPRTDPIARVEASRLRSRLELYYATEGAADPVVIALPKGGYVPTFEPKSVTENGTSAAEQQGSSRRTFLMLGIALAGFLLGVVASSLMNGSSPPVNPVAEMRLMAETPPTTDPLSLALSPDAKTLAFVAASGGKAKLWIRPLDSTTAQPLTGTDGASFPFWSPDNRALAFFADGLLKRVDIEGGLVRPLSRAVVPGGGAWSTDGTILFPLVPNSPLYRVSENGGEPVVLTRFLPRQNGHRAPRFLPDYQHFVYYAASPNPEVRGIYVGDLRDGEFAKRVIAEADSPAVYVNGNLLFLRQKTLFAQRFDPERLEATGQAHAIAESIAIASASGIAALSASDTGVIAFRTGASGKRQLVWFDRSGKELKRLGAPADLGPGYVSISPDDRQFVTQQTVDGNTDVYLLSTQEGGGSVKLTSSDETEIAPIWSSGGDRVAYASLDGNGFNLFQVDLAGSPREPVWASDQSKQPTDWVADTLLFRSLDPQMDWDIWALPMTGARTPVPVVRTRFEERDARFSPDMKWVAYQSNELGRFEIYLQPYPGPGEKVRVSTNGGASVHWGSDGKELFYLALDGTLVSVPLDFAADGRKVETIGMARSLFSTNVNSVQDLRRSYAVSRDGKRFLIDTMVEEEVPPITVILNWKSPGT
jgi:Tol biopolymer transport system component